MALTKQAYSCTRSFPKEETYGLTSQIRRACVSIPANTAEGQARNSTGEFLQFLGIAKGSLAELETLLQLSKELSFLDENKAKALLETCEEISRLLSGLRKSLAT